MSIENILNKIEKDKEDNVREILREAEEKSDEVGEEYSKAIINLKEKLRKKAEKKAREEEERIIVNERLKLKKSLLSKKQEILDDLYNEAKEKIETLAEDQYIDFMKRLILDRAISGKEEIIVPSGQEKLFDVEFISALNETYGDGGELSLAPESGNFKWGVVLREENRVVDLTLDVIFEQLKEKVEPSVAALLFEDKYEED